MRFVVDECTGPTVARWLQQQGHDVVSIYDDFRGALDEWVLQKAFKEARILITNDKDFGEMIFRERRPHRGVIFFRLEDERSANVIRVLQSLLSSHADRLEGHYAVVTETRIRFALGGR